MPKAVLWIGQLLNILAVMVLYPMAIKVGRNRWAGVVAVLVAGSANVDFVARASHVPAPGETMDAVFYWSGKGLNWDVYAHTANGPGSVYNLDPSRGRACRRPCTRNPRA